MNTLLKISAAIVIFAALSSSSYALVSIADVSEKKAKEMGIEVRSKASGPKHVRVEIEFKTEGSLKGFDPENYGRIEMRVRDDDQSIERGERTLINAALQVKRPKPGNVSVAFTARRDQIARVSVMIYLGGGLRTHVAFNLDLKDFVNLEKLDLPVTSPKSEKAKPDVAELPAATE